MYDRMPQGGDGYDGGSGGFDDCGSCNNYGCGNDDFDDRMREGSGMGRRHGGASDTSSGFHGGHFVHTRGLPFPATDNDIADLFHH